MIIRAGYIDMGTSGLPGCRQGRYLQIMGVLDV